MNALRKAERKVQEDQKHQLRVMNIVCFLSLHRMGMDADTIIKRFNEATAIWVECREKKVSAFQILEEETGIELALDGEKSYKEFDQLKWRTETLTPTQYIYSINRRKRWVSPLILACMCLALHRAGDDRIEEFLQKTDEQRRQTEDLKVLIPMMEQETGYTPRLWGE